MSRLTPISRAATLFAIAAFFTAASVINVSAMDSGSDPEPEVKCSKGKIYDKRIQQCVMPK